MCTLTLINIHVNSVIPSVVYIHRDDELTIQKITGDSIEVIDASTSAQAIPDNVNHYIVEEIDIYIIEKDPRFMPYRFAYVNNHGGTDYVNFSLADAEDLKIKRQFFDNNNDEKLYDIEVKQEFTVFSQSFTEEQSRQLKYLWISPLIHLIKDGIHYPVNIKTKSAPILNRENGLIFYNITFQHEAKFNIQK